MAQPRTVFSMAKPGNTSMPNNDVDRSPEAGVEMLGQAETPEELESAEVVKQTEAAEKDAKSGKKDTKDPRKKEEAQLDAQLEHLRKRTLNLDPSAAITLVRESARLQLDARAIEERLKRIWKINAFIVVASIGFVVSAIYMFPKWRYVATTDNDAICEITAVANASVSPTDITEYAKDGIIDALNFDYVNYRMSINNAMSKWFTEAGRKAYLFSLEQNGNLNRVIKGRFILRSMATHVPQIEREGLKGNSRYWIVQVPLSIEFYQGGDVNPIHKQAVLAAITVLQSEPTKFNKKGLGIDNAVTTTFAGIK
jgi:intracellular multiplication protein IcmL